MEMGAFGLVPVRQSGFQVIFPQLFPAVRALGDFLDIEIRKAMGPLFPVPKILDPDLKPTIAVSQLVVNHVVDLLPSTPNR